MHGVVPVQLEYRGVVGLLDKSERLLIAVKSGLCACYRDGRKYTLVLSLSALALN